MQLTKKQIEGLKILLSNEYSEILFDGGSRAGKTFLICHAFIILCGVFPNIRCLMARYRFNHAKASIWMQTLIPMLVKEVGGVYDIDKQNSIIRFNNGSEIWLAGLDDKERAEKILGQEFACCFLNEATQISKSVVEKIKTRLAQNIEGFKNFIVFDCNPRHPQHYLYQDFYINKTPERAQLHWTPFDNEANLPQGYIDRLRALDEVSRIRFLEGKWAKPEGAVHPNIKAENFMETKKDPYYYDDVSIGIDFGLHSAVTVWGIKGKNAYCLYEWTIINGSTQDIIDSLNSIDWLKNYTAYCDHEPDRIQLLSDSGYNAKKAHKEVNNGDSIVNSYELYFDHSCKNTFQSMLNLTHAQDKNDNYIESHVKENDHEADSSRYSIASWKMENQKSELLTLNNVFSY
jgi:phage terminase large subunit